MKLKITKKDANTIKAEFTPPGAKKAEVLTLSRSEWQNLQKIVELAFGPGNFSFEYEAGQ